MNKKIEQFKKAWVELSKELANTDKEGDATLYPVEQSFDELYIDMSEWLDSLKEELQ